MGLVYGPATVVHVACGQHLSVRTAAVDEVVHHKAHVVAVDGSGTHLVQNPHRQEIVCKAHVGIARPLVVIVSGVNKLARRDVAAVNQFDYVVVHVGILVINGDSGREHVSQDHPFAEMPRNGFIGLGRVTAFHPSGNAHELLDVGLALFRGEFRVAPVVNYSAHHHHHAACAGEILLGAESAVFQGIKHVRDSRTGGGPVPFREIIQGIQLHPACEPAHLEIIAEAAVLLRFVLFRSAGNREFLQPCNDFFPFGRCNP